MVGLTPQLQTGAATDSAMSSWPSKLPTDARCRSLIGRMQDQQMSVSGFGNLPVQVRLIRVRCDWVALEAVSAGPERCEHGHEGQRFHRSTTSSMRSRCAFLRHHAPVPAVMPRLPGQHALLVVVDGRCFQDFIRSSVGAARQDGLHMTLRSARDQLARTRDLSRDPGRRRTAAASTERHHLQRVLAQCRPGRATARRWHRRRCCGRARTLGST